MKWFSLANGLGMVGKCAVKRGLSHVSGLDLQRLPSQPVQVSPRSLSKCFSPLLVPALAVLTACGGGNASAPHAATPAGVAEGRATTQAVVRPAALEAAAPAPASVQTTALQSNTNTAVPGDASRGDGADEAADWIACAAEGQTCNFKGVQQVRYGTPSHYVSRAATDGVACSNAVFGDPVVGTPKTCWTAALAPAAGFDPSRWMLCATENGTCSFDGSREVRYGTSAVAVTRLFSASTACSNGIFGDPVVGTTKSCWVAVPAPAAIAWTACATEGQFCAFSGSRQVRYGSGSAFAFKTVADGVDCSNAVFGDPLWGTTKSCSFALADAGSPAPQPLPAQPAAPVLPAQPAPPAVRSVAMVLVSPVEPLVIGAATSLVATAVDASGIAFSNLAFTWSVDDPSVATVDAAGTATPIRAGYTQVTARAGDKSASTVVSVRGPVAIPTRSKYVGTNLGGVAYYGPNFPFVDLMKSGGGWSSRDDAGHWGAAFPATSADGYPAALAPGQHALAAVAWTGTHYPAGNYTLLWDGSGTLSFPISNVTVVENKPGRMVVRPNDLNASIFVSIDATNGADPVRNVRFLLPGAEATYATQPFNPTFLEKTAPFSLIRFMDWGATNDSPIVGWTDRAQLKDVAWTTPKGVPIETMIDLANTLHVDPWFCIPHMASDDYVAKFAQLLHDRLDPALRPHIEYSNEVWNTGFPQTRWANDQSAAQGLDRPWGTPSIFYAKRAVQMFDIMRRVYGAADAPRLVRVLAGQAAWTQFLENALGSANTAANVDVMAIAPYFNATAADDPANVAATLALTPGQVVDQMVASIRGDVKNWMTSNAALAARYHLPMKAYESGPGDSVSYFPNDRKYAMTALFSAANASPRMKDVYTEYYGQWKAAGGDTMNQYSDITAWTQYGFWGALEYVTQDPATAPKYQGLLAFIAANPGAANKALSKTSGTSVR